MKKPKEVILMMDANRQGFTGVLVIPEFTERLELNALVGPSSVYARLIQ